MFLQTDAIWVMKRPQIISSTYLLTLPTGFVANLQPSNLSCRNPTRMLEGRACFRSSRVLGLDNWTFLSGAMSPPTESAMSAPEAPEIGDFFEGPEKTLMLEFKRTKAGSAIEI